MKDMLDFLQRFDTDAKEAPKEPEMKNEDSLADMRRVLDIDDELNASQSAEIEQVRVGDFMNEGLEEIKEDVKEIV